MKVEQSRDLLGPTSTHAAFGAGSPVTIFGPSSCQQVVDQPHLLAGSTLRLVVRVIGHASSGAEQACRTPLARLLKREHNALNSCQPEETHAR